MEQSQKGCKVHPMVLFWLGVLTGALVVGVVFLYGTYQSQNLKDQLMRSDSGTTTNIQGPSI